MPEQTYTQVMSSLSAKNFSPTQLSSIYLVTGSDDSLKREIVTRLLTLGLDPDFADFDRETIDFGAGSSAPDGEADPAPRILSAAGMAPFMSPRRVVVVTGVQRLTKERQGALAAGIKQLGNLSLLIMVADAPEFEGGRPKGRQLETTFKKAVAVAGTVVNCDTPQPADLKQRAAALLASFNKTPEPGVVDAIAEHAAAVSANAGSGAVATLTRECEKLRTYVGERETITKADAEELMPDVAEENIFRLLDAVGARNVKQAMDYVDAMLAANDRADGVAARTLVMLQRHMRMLMLGKFAAENRIDAKSGGLSSDMKDLLSSELLSTMTGQSYRVSAYSRQAAKFTWDDLIWSTSRILATDLTMKGIRPPDSLGATSPVSGDDPASALRLLVAQLCTGMK